MELEYKQMCGVFYRRTLKKKLKRHLNTNIDITVNKRRMSVDSESEVAALLEILSDGEWHGLAALQHHVGLAERKMQGIAAFLCAFNFAVVDSLNRRVKVNRDFREFLART